MANQFNPGAAPPSNAPYQQPLFPPTGPQSYPPPPGPQNYPPPPGPQNYPPPPGPQNFQPPPSTDGRFPIQDSRFPTNPSNNPPFYDAFDPIGGPPYDESSSVFDPSASEMEPSMLRGRPTKKSISPRNSGPRLIKSPEREQVILAKRFSLLIFLFIIMGAAGVGTAIWATYESKLGNPPTEFSETAYENTLFAIISLFLVTLLSIIILRGKIHHMAVGFILMFLYSLTFYFSLKGASRAYNSIKYDDIVTIEKYVFRNNDKSRGELPQFFHRLQINFKCCGTSTIDKLMDWPYRLQSQDFPQSCCKEVTKTCGKLLGRTYDYTGAPGEPMRSPSGYFLALTEKEMEGIIRTEKPVKISLPPEKDHGLEILLNVIKDFYFKSLAKGYPPGTPIQDMRRSPNDIIEPHDVEEEHLPTAIGCSDPSALEKVTTIGWEMQRMLDYETSIIHLEESPQKYEWIAWKIPLCREMAGVAPFLLASNFKREITNVHEDVKRMWYISKGITENFILKDILWEKHCEGKQNLEYVPDLPIVSWIVGKPKKSKQGSRNPVIGKFFISFINQLMVACLFLSLSAAILLGIVFLIFWKYYSRMKLEEYANLPYPREFEVLKVRQSDLYVKHDKAEYDKQKSKKLKEKDEENNKASLDYEGIRAEFDRMFVSAEDTSHNAPNDNSMQYGPDPQQNEAYPYPGEYSDISYH